MGFWLNVMDFCFNLYLCGDYIVEVWVVEKFMKCGFVILVEVFDVDGVLIF